MKETTYNLFIESYNDIVKSVESGFQMDNLDLVEHGFLRLFRIQRKINDLLGRTSEGYPEKLVSLNNVIRVKMSMWKSLLANRYEIDGNFEQAEKEWLSCLSFQAEPEHYIQYSHAVLKSKNLYVHKDVVENMTFINRFNVKDIKQALLRSRITLKYAIGDQGTTEATSYFLTWIDLVERAISDNSEFSEVLNNDDDEEFTLDVVMEELNRLIGMNEVKRKIKEISNWVTFTKMRISQGLKADEISLHMIFSGNPGTGKTTVARIVATIYKALGVLEKGHLVEVGRSDLVAEYVGQTAVKTMNKLKEAENGVLFIDEAYSLTRSGGNDFGIEAVDTLVKCMEDKRKNLVVILAGYPKEMKIFLQSNPGLQSRFKFHIKFPDYTIEELIEIHRLILNDKQYTITEEAELIVKDLISEMLIANPTTHGNGRMVRNLIEDEILSKAAYIVSEDNELLTEENDLEILDETILRMVALNVNKDVKRFNVTKIGTTM